MQIHGDAGPPLPVCARREQAGATNRGARALPTIGSMHSEKTTRIIHKTGNVGPSWPLRDLFALPLVFTRSCAKDLRTDDPEHALNVVELPAAFCGNDNRTVHISEVALVR